MAEGIEKLKEKNKRNFFMIEKRFGKLEETLEDLEKKNKKASKLMEESAEKLEKKLEKKDMEKIMNKRVKSVRKSLKKVKEGLLEKMDSLEEGVKETSVNAEQISELEETVSVATVDLKKMRDRLTKDYQELRKKQNKDSKKLAKHIDDMEMNQIEMGKKVENISTKMEDLGNRFDKQASNFESQVRKDLKGIIREELKRMEKEIKEHTQELAGEVEDTEAKQLDLAVHMNNLSEELKKTVDSQMSGAVERFSETLDQEIENKTMDQLEVGREVKELSKRIEALDDKVTGREKTKEMVEEQVEKSMTSHAQEMETSRVSVLDTARSVEKLASDMDTISKQIERMNDRMDEMGKIRTEDVNAIMRDQFEKFTQTLDKTFSKYPTKDEIRSTLESYKRQRSRQEMDTLQSLANTVRRMDKHLSEVHGLITNFSRRLPVVIE